MASRIGWAKFVTHSGGGVGVKVGIGVDVGRLVGVSVGAKVALGATDGNADGAIFASVGDAVHAGISMRSKTTHRRRSSPECFLVDIFPPAELSNQSKVLVQT